jgi:hypothetical protein
MRFRTTRISIGLTFALLVAGALWVERAFRADLRRAEVRLTVAGSGAASATR